MFLEYYSTLDFLNNLNDKTIFNMQVFDFTTLYTRLDLSVVDQNINGVIDLIFSDRNKYICVHKFDSNKYYFSKKEYNGYYTFNKTKLKEAVKFIINNTYIVFFRYSFKTDFRDTDGRKLEFFDSGSFSRMG